MKKTKFLALVLVVAIMMMGAGYAAWQETLTINHTVSTGNVDVDLGGTDDIVVYQDSDAPNGDELARTAEVVGSDQTATVTVDNLYPGAKVVVNIPVTNNSTIPVKYISTGKVDVPTWLTVTDICPQELAVNGTGKIVVTMIVKDGVDGPTEKTLDTKFTLTPLYEQWNTK